MENEDEIRQTITMVYDDYERENGDGLYPQLPPSCPACTAQVKIGFILMTDNNQDSYWIQSTDTPIHGLDGDCGVKLFNILNENYKAKYNRTIINIKGIKNRSERVLYSTF